MTSSSKLLAYPCHGRQPRNCRDGAPSVCRCISQEHRLEIRRSTNRKATDLHARHSRLLTSLHDQLKAKLATTDAVVVVHMCKRPTRRSGTRLYLCLSRTGKPSRSCRTRACDSRGHAAASRTAITRPSGSIRSTPVRPPNTTATISASSACPGSRWAQWPSARASASRDG